MHGHAATEQLTTPAGGGVAKVRGLVEEREGSPVLVQRRLHERSEPEKDRRAVRVTVEGAAVRSFSRVRIALDGLV